MRGGWGKGRRQPGDVLLEHDLGHVLRIDAELVEPAVQPAERAAVAHGRFRITPFPLEVGQVRGEDGMELLHGSSFRRTGFTHGKFDLLGLVGSLS